MNTDDELATLTILNTLLSEREIEGVPNVTYDWKAYFQEFMRVHGGDPVQYGAQLVFRDGWRYSAYEYAGPETPPPDDPDKVRQLKRIYWKRRIRSVLPKVVRARAVVNQATQLSEIKSLPLQQVKTYEDSGGQLRRDSMPIDLSSLQERLDGLEADLEECYSQLKGLE